MVGSSRRFALVAAIAVAPCTAGVAAEVTVKNDSLPGAAATIVTGFVAGEKVASWLTTPCAGNIRAAQVFWASMSGSSPPALGRSIEIFHGGTFPDTGAVAETILGPVLSDGVVNEYRYLDENSVVPLIVPVTQDQTFVVAFTFDSAPPAQVGPSVVRDTNGCQAGRNGILESGSVDWVSSCAFGFSGDFAIRAVVDCAGDPIFSHGFEDPG